MMFVQNRNYVKRCIIPSCIHAERYGTQIYARHTNISVPARRALESPHYVTLMTLTILLITLAYLPLSSFGS